VIAIKVIQINKIKKKRRKVAILKRNARVADGEKSQKWSMSWPSWPKPI